MFWITFYAWKGTETSLMPADGILSAFIAGTVGFIIVPGGIGTYPIMVGMRAYFLSLAQLSIWNSRQRRKAMPSHIGFGVLVWATQTLLIVFLGLLVFREWFR